VTAALCLAPNLFKKAKFLPSFRLFLTEQLHMFYASQGNSLNRSADDERIGSRSKTIDFV
jgi:hypothetical protein